MFDDSPLDVAKCVLREQREAFDQVNGSFWKRYIFGRVWNQVIEYSDTKQLRKGLGKIRR